MWWIGIGKVSKRILGKAIVLATLTVVKVLYGSDHLCSGVKLDIKEEIHWMKDLFKKMSSESYGLLMVDTKDAFDSVNSVAALWNAKVL